MISMIFACLLSLPAFSADSATLMEGVISSGHLPLIAKGGIIESGKDKKNPAFIERKFELGTPGIWYVWLQVSSMSGDATVVSYSLDGNQVLKPPRREIMVPPRTKKQWVQFTRYRFAPGFRAQIHVDKPGIHTLKLESAHGAVEIHRVALTLHHGAEPKGDTLNHADDPGRGRSIFPMGDMSLDGVQEGRKGPEQTYIRTFYIDADKGTDSSDGLSPAGAWRTVGRASQNTFKPGDAILLKRGGLFKGTMAPAGDGAEGKPITIGAFGEGARPVIEGIDASAVRLKQQSFWVIRDIAATSNPERKDAGIEALAIKGKTQPRDIRIYNCVAWDNGGTGIHVGGGEEEDNGYDGIIVDNCKSFWNGADGIQVNGSDQNGCRNAVVRYCTTYGNPGMAGIWIHSGQNGLIERCKSYNNACINIWTWNSINVTIRHCEAFRGVPPKDAGGFDIDWGCEGCTMEYCYSHQNMGVGFLIMGHGFNDYRGYTTQSRYNLMRFCVSEGDSPGIGSTETYQFGITHNNTVVAVGRERAALDIGGWPPEPWSEKSYSGGWPSDSAFYNNILVGLEGALPMWVDDFATRQNNRFDNNLYFRARSEGPLMKWAGRRCGEGFWEGSTKGQIPAQEFTDIKKFRKASSQEAGGKAADPKLTAPGEGGYGRLPLPAYRVKPGSIVKGSGKKVELEAAWLAERAKYLTETGAEKWGIPMAPVNATEDYWGQALGNDNVPSIGAEK